MRNLLPGVGPNGEYVRPTVESVDAWIPGIKEIARLHGIRAADVSRFTRGENPVFQVNERVVLKLLPRRSAHLALRERECLEWLSRCRTIPLPTLVGSGELDDWSYLLTTRLPGRPLSELWNELGVADQEAIAAELGQLLARLHNLPLDGFLPGGIRWPEFLLERTEAWPGRPGVARLPPQLRESGPEYIARAQLIQVGDRPMFLQGDLAPENCLISNTGGTWRVSAILDFGNAIAGHALFDFTALTALLAPGCGRIVNKVFEGYGLGPETAAISQPILMAYTLLHPLGDPSELLGLIPGLDRTGSWEEVAEAFWPAS